MAQMGRPRKQIDKADLESLLAINCTCDECVGFLDNKLPDGCSESALRRFVKAEYGCTFEQLAEKKRTLFKIRLRRNQIKLSEKNAAMAIFLGKNYLGQKDNPDIDESPAVIKAVAELLKGVDSVID